jgi:hypothetical protein
LQRSNAKHRYRTMIGIAGQFQARLCMASINEVEHDPVQFEMKVAI